MNDMMLHQVMKQGKKNSGGVSRMGHMNKVNKGFGSIGHAVKKLGGGAKELISSK